MKTSLALVFLLLSAGTASAQTTSEASEASYEVVPVSEVQWEKLNPARGDQSPQAGTLWGDRKGPVPTGFLAKFVDGFSSPPHIHNATYRAVVISGLIHNDDPAAAEMWMPPGSFWAQPKGEVHITAAKGSHNVALVEIDKGPYLVKPVDAAFDSGERPVNVDVSNLVWVDPPGLPSADDGPKLAYLWGSLKGNEANGTFIKLPAGFQGTLHSHASTFRVVVIQGQLKTSDKVLGPGSYVGSKGERKHQIAAQKDQDVVLYVRSEGAYELRSR